MIAFTKAHACGNDFLVVDRAQVRGADEGELARLLCARTTGVGADGVEFFEWTQEGQAGEREGRIHLRNADGSIAEISGNGTRCVAAWMAREVSAGAGSVLKIETDAGLRECRIIHADGNAYEIASGMGVPALAASSLELADGRTVEGVQVLTGNPHFVIFVEPSDYSVGGRSWESMGEEICRHPDFPKQTNVEFVRILSKDEISIRIFERGVGPTSSSGTGTCASASAAMTFRGCARTLRVVAPGGTQVVEWLDPDAEMLLTGPAVIVETGTAFVPPMRGVLEGGGR